MLTVSGKATKEIVYYLHACLQKKRVTLISERLNINSPLCLHLSRQNPLATQIIWLFPCHNCSKQVSIGKLSNISIVIFYAYKGCPLAIYIPLVRPLL